MNTPVITVNTQLILVELIDKLIPILVNINNIHTIIPKFYIQYANSLIQIINSSNKCNNSVVIDLLFDSFFFIFNLEIINNKEINRTYTMENGSILFNVISLFTNNILNSVNSDSISILIGLFYNLLNDKELILSEDFTSTLVKDCLLFLQVKILEKDYPVSIKILYTEKIIQLSINKISQYHQYVHLLLSILKIHYKTGKNFNYVVENFEIFSSIAPSLLSLSTVYTNELFDNWIDYYLHIHNVLFKYFCFLIPIIKEDFYVTTKYGEGIISKIFGDKIKVQLDYGDAYIYTKEIDTSSRMRNGINGELIEQFKINEDSLITVNK